VLVEELTRFLGWRMAYNPEKIFYAF
jgi:hypothetical protein